MRGRFMGGTGTTRSIRQNKTVVNNRLDQDPEDWHES
jgi:hypothetical protein